MHTHPHTVQEATSQQRGKNSPVAPPCQHQGLLLGWHVTGNAKLPPPLCPQQLVMDSPEVLSQGWASLLCCATGPLGFLDSRALQPN